MPNCHFQNRYPVPIPPKEGLLVQFFNSTSLHGWFFLGSSADKVTQDKDQASFRRIVWSSLIKETFQNFKNVFSFSISENNCIILRCLINQPWGLSALELVSNSSRHSLKGPEFKSCSRH